MDWELDREKWQGILFGLAIGDSLGYPVEFMKKEEIIQRYGEKGVTGPFKEENNLFSDDTQMTLAICRALIRKGDGTYEELMEAIGEEFIRWKNSPENNRAPGNTCMKGVSNLEKGMSWRESGVPDSKGCGSVMRVAPVGYFFSQDLERLKTAAHGSGIMTHGHPAADAACIGGAYAVKLGLDEVEPEEYIPLLKAFIKDISKEMEEKLDLVQNLLENNLPEEESLSQIGEGWTGEEALALGLYCFLKHPDSYPKAVLLGANTNGDSDSIACIAGYLSGARLGIHAIPPEWIHSIEKRDYLYEIADQVWEKKKICFGGKE